MSDTWDSLELPIEWAVLNREKRLHQIELKIKNSGGKRWIARLGGGVMKQINMCFSEKIKLQRKNKRMSLKQLSDEIGLSVSHLFNLENNRIKNPGIDTLMKISVFFNKSPNYFLLNEKSNPADKMFYSKYLSMSDKNKAKARKSFEILFSDSYHNELNQQ
jgi:transcriptional regulator with XRE-family HTH domain